MTIPARVHFCWIGSSLPWAYVFAVLSAAERSGLPEIILHHTDALEDGAGLRALRDAPGVRLSPVEPLACLAEVGAMLRVGGGLAALYRRLESPVKRADILRAAILYAQGGVYLDLDTVTTATLLPLLACRQFVGSEFIVWPRRVRSSRSPLTWTVHLGLDLLRKALRRMPGGWKLFRRVERLYPRGINNAVMGAQAGSRLFSEYLLAMLSVPAGRDDQPYALGPDLLGEVIARIPPGEVTVYEPEVFYPLPPEISEHWFRIGRSPIGKEGRLDAVLSPKTRVVHWYASVRRRSRIAGIDPGYVREHRHRQLYSMLVSSCLRDLPRA